MAVKQARAFWKVETRTRGRKERCWSTYGSAPAAEHVRARFRLNKCRREENRL